MTGKEFAGNIADTRKINVMYNVQMSSAYKRDILNRFQKALAVL